MCTVDLNGDGRDEILVPKNSGGSFLSAYNKAEFIGLGWTGARFEQRWSIGDIPGAVLDYQIIRQQGSGTQILALIMTPGGSVRGRPRSRDELYAEVENNQLSTFQVILNVLFCISPDFSIEPYARCARMSEKWRFTRMKSKTNP